MFFLTTLFEFLAEPEIMGGTVLMYKIYYTFAPAMVALPWLMPELKLLLAFLLCIITVANLTFKFVLEE